MAPAGSENPPLSRRRFLTAALAFGVHTLALGSPFRALADAVASEGPYGPLLPPNADGVQLPEGFGARVIAQAGEAVANTGLTWHGAPDGGATFKARGGFIYVSNSERSAGGVNALRFDKQGEIVDGYPILQGSRRNCAGGVTPWDTWLSCEEISDGIVWECDPEGRRPAEPLPALGTFRHEAACYDKKSRAVYLTEDEEDGCFYRFLPHASGRLDAGVLEVAIVDEEGRVTWEPVPMPNPGRGELRTRYQVAGATPFDGGEGIACAFGRIFFTTKGDDRVWRYDPKKQLMSIYYEHAPGLALAGVDNVTAGRKGALVVAEDGGNMELVLITKKLEVAPIFRLPFDTGSELTGPAFDPRGRRLFVSSQRGGAAREGTTWEITGPFKRKRRAR